MRDEKQDIVWTRGELCAEVIRLHSVNAALVGALKNVAAACRGSGPWARDHDADTLRTIGKMIEPTLTAARTGED